MRRLFWALTGIGLGAVVGLRVARAVSSTKARYSPAGIAAGAGGAMDRLRARLRDAMDAGREEMHVREAELRTELNLPPSNGALR